MNTREISELMGQLQPELALAGGIVVLMVASAFRANPRILVLIATLAVVVAMVLQTIVSENITGFLLFRGNYSKPLTVAVDLAGLLTLFMTLRSHQLYPDKSLTINKFNGEFQLLILGLLLGCHFLLQTDHLLMIFLSMELISISSYLLTGFRFTRLAAEGSIKYFIFGSTVSALMLYGISLLYGTTGTLHLHNPEFLAGISGTGDLLTLVAILLTGAGFLFKLSSAPFHFWAPDAYDAAPLPAVALISVAPKIAVLVPLEIFMRNTASSRVDWAFLLGAMALLTIGAGNFAALRQRSFRRLMAYSSVAQSGFLLMGFAAGSNQGITFTYFYALVYSVANFVVFLHLQHQESEGRTELTHWSGLGRITPVQMILLLTAFVSLIGLPPLAGFTGKLFLFSSLWEGYSDSAKPILAILLIWGILNTVISMYYYLRIPFYAFFRSIEGLQNSSLTTKSSRFETLLGLILVIMLIVAFLQPGLLMGWLNKVTFVP